MKKLSILILSLILLACALGLTACGHTHSFTNYISNNDATYLEDGTKTATCDRDGCSATDTVTDDGSKLQAHISFKNLTVTENNVYGVVSNNTETFSFIDEVERVGDVTYSVTLDEFGINPTLTKIVPLSVGDNKVYVFEMVDNEVIKYYTVTIRRRPMYEVTFNSNGGSLIDFQTVEEDSLAVIPETDPTRAGYTFDGWDFDFANPITDYTTIDAKWSPNENTPYKVEYYLENLDNDDYTKLDSETENLTGTTDTTVYAEIKTFEHFTAESSTVSGNVNPDGSTVLKVYYQRNEYTVTFDLDGGTRTGGALSQKVKYGGSVTVPTTAKTGYTFNGFDKTNYTNISESFIVKANWTINQYTLTIVYGNGQENKEITQDYNTEIQTIENPERGGYGFNGWDKVMPTKMPANNITITAKWSAIFNLNGGEITGLTTYGQSLTEIVISEYIDGVEITSIGDDAFFRCRSLTSVTIPDSVESIGDLAFYYCDSLTKTNYTGTIDQWAMIEFADYNSNPIYHSNNLYINDVLVTEVNLTTATHISDYAFSSCDSLTSVTIGDSVEIIGYRAFYDCTSLESVVIGDSVESIGGGAFSYCSSLTSVTIPDSVKSIGDDAFFRCRSLTSVTIGDSVESIGEKAFYACISLTKTNYTGTIDQWAMIEFAGSDSNPIYYSHNLYINDVLVTEVNLTTATHISNYAFKYCYSLESVVIGNSVKSIGNDAFYGCYKLVEVYNESNLSITAGSTDYGYVGYYALNVYTPTIGQSKLSYTDDGYVIYTDGQDKILVGYLGEEADLILPSDITEIYNYAFYDCDSLTSVTIPDSVESIGSFAFAYCDLLTSVTIGNNVTSIHPRAFEYCTSLKSITFNGTMEEWNAITKGIWWNHYIPATFVQCSDGRVDI